jgi:hypothetical protein
MGRCVSVAVGGEAGVSVRDDVVVDVGEVAVLVLG